MKHLFVPYKIALGVAAKDFNEPCMAIYLNEYSTQAGLLKQIEFTACNENISGPNWEDDVLFLTYNNSNLYKQYTAAPTYQQVVDWFRDKHNICIYVDETNRPHIMGTILPTTGRIEYPRLAEISRIVGVSQHRVYTWPTYYEALTEDINHAIKLI